MTEFAPVWHVTRPAAATKIARQGFRRDVKPHFGRLWADGTYLSLDEESAEIYTDYSFFRGWDYVLIEAAVKVEASFIYQAEGTPTEIKRGSVCWDAGESILPLVGAKALTRYRKLRQKQEPSTALTAVLVEYGYDSLLVEADPIDTAFGGNQLIVFDPSRINVVSIGETLQPPVITPLRAVPVS